MNTIKAFTAEDATVIVGTVIDEAIGDMLRVTMVATGLGSPVNRAQNKPLTRRQDRNRFEPCRGD